MLSPLRARKLKLENPQFRFVVILHWLWVSAFNYILVRHAVGCGGSWAGSFHACGEGVRPHEKLCRKSTVAIALMASVDIDSDEWSINSRNYTFNWHDGRR